MIGDIISFLDQGWIGSIIGILGFLFACFTYRNSKIGEKLVYQFTGLRLIGDRKSEEFPEEVKVLFKDKKVSSLYKVYIILWNFGKKTIHGENIVNDDLLKIIFNEETEILKTNIITRSRDINNFQLNINKDKHNQIDFSFDFLDPKDGVVIEILHTGIKIDFEITGTIRGIPKGIQNLGKIPPYSFPSLFGRILPPPFNNMRNPFLSFTTISSIIIFLVGIFLPYIEKIKLPFDIPDLNSRWFFILLGIIYGFFSVMIYFKERIKFPKILEFDEFRY